MIGGMISWPSNDVFTKTESPGVEPLHGCVVDVAGVAPHGLVGGGRGGAALDGDRDVRRAHADRSGGVDALAPRSGCRPNEMMPRTNMPKIGASRGTDEEKCVGVYRRRRSGHALPREKGVARPSREMWRHVLPATQGVGEPRKVRRPCDHPRRTAGTQALRVAPDLPAVPFPGTETSCQDSIVVLRQEARCSPHCSAQPSLRRHDDKAST